MKATIGITSFNRFKYFKVLLESLSSLSRKDFQFIVVDNCSIEPGLQDYILQKQEEGEIHLAFLRDPKDRNWTNDEYIAKNIIIENSSSEMILFLEDDLQFIGNEKSLVQVIEDFESLPGLCMELNGIRKISTQNDVACHRFFQVPSGYKYWASDDNHYQTMGLFKKQVFRIFGKYPVEWPQTQEYWGRSEDVYDATVKQKFANAQINISSHVPMFLPVWNDIRGGYAFIRGDRRYGQYAEPPHKSGLYYQQIENEEYNQLQSEEFPLSFPEIAKPLGWDYAKDPTGDQKKYNQREIMEQEFGTLFSEPT